jgi:hypothetical protein
MLTGRRISAIALLGLLAALLAGCGGSDNSSKSLSIVAPAKGVTLKRIDLGTPGTGPGDQIVFDGPLVSADGKKPVGHVYGTQTAISESKGSEVVQAFITYDLGGGNSITVGGVGQYPAGGKGLVANKTFVRPILGGTGTYEAADGTLTSVHQSDGSYRQTFKVED